MKNPIPAEVSPKGLIQMLASRLTAGRRVEAWFNTTGRELCLVVSVELNARGETLCVLRRENGDEWNYTYESGELVAVAPTKGPKSNRKQTGPMLAHPAPAEWAHERSRRLATEKERNDFCEKYANSGVGQ
jgi:hypothetical protein